MMLDHRYDNVRVSTILPGSVATDFGGQAPNASEGARNDSWKIAAEDVAEVVMNVLQMPPRTLVSLVEMRPAQPRKQK